ncbi:hypothetical protein A3Q56_03054 [Intoshia linei]|uniref:C2 domain-containing protein n=1 Tax=Intoshia linei TaxID=1819745 RepID=A0A177B6J5_9BILA|nr:hypothetical protein A3Q56_03054 [Intoshia linei]
MYNFNNTDYLEIFVSCSQLINLDYVSKTDAMCVLFVKNFEKWTFYAKTEIIPDCLNPVFIQSFKILYDDLDNELLFSIYDIDNEFNDLVHQEYLGSLRIKLSDLIKHKNTSFNLTRSLMIEGHSKSRGNIHLTSEYVNESKADLVLIINANIYSSGFFSKKKSYFFQIARSFGSNEYHNIYASEIVNSKKLLKWKFIKLSLQKLNNTDYRRNIKFIISTGSNGGKFDLVRFSKKIQNVKKRGQLIIISCNIEQNYSLIDYVNGGLEFDLNVAIDMSLSNGLKNDPTSLHFVQESLDNSYIGAMKLYLPYLFNFISQKKINVTLFGSTKKMKTTLVEANLDKFLEFYNKSIKNVKMGGPTKITNLLTNFLTKCGQAENKCFLLIIFTDGIINDYTDCCNLMNTVKDKFVNIIFVTLGLANNHFMTSILNKFNCNDLNNQKKVFVDIINLNKKMYINERSVSMVIKSLTQLSNNIVSYMKCKNVIPKNHTNENLLEEKMAFYEMIQKNNTYNNLKISQKNDYVCPTCGSTINKTWNSNEKNEKRFNLYSISDKIKKWLVFK